MLINKVLAGRWPVLMPLVISLALPASCGKEEAMPPELVGVEPVKEVRLFEDHLDSYGVWCRAGVRHRVAFHFDSHLDMNYIRESDLGPLLEIKNLRQLHKLAIFRFDYYRSGVKVIGVDNWLYPAFRRGLMDTLYWIVPDTSIGDEVWMEQFKEHLRNYQSGLFPAEIEGFRAVPAGASGGRLVKGTVYGCPLIVTTLESLPPRPTPVLLDVDVDYFVLDGVLSLNRLPWPRVWPEDVIVALREKGIRTDLATICYSVNKGFNPLEYRFLGDRLKRLLAGPTLLDSGRRELALRSKAEEERVGGSPAAAAAMYRELLGRDPGDASLWYALSLAERAAGRPEPADSCFRAAVEREPAYGQEKLFRADAAFYNREYREALEGYRELIDSGTIREPVLYFNVGDCLLNLNDSAGALKYYLAAAEQDGDFGPAWYQASVAALALGRVDSALVLVRRDVATNPDRAAYQGQLARCLSLAGRRGEAERAARWAMELAPWSGRYPFILGTIQLQAGRFREASRYFRQAVELAPRRSEAYYNLGLSLVSLRSYTGAIKAYEKALELKPGAVDYRLALGRVFVMTGDWRQALDCFRKVLDSRPDSRPALINISRVLIEMKRWDEAGRMIERTGKLYPRDPLNWFHRALVDAGRGDYVAAGAALEKAVAYGGDRVREMAVREPVLRPLRGLGRWREIFSGKR